MREFRTIVAYGPAKIFELKKKGDLANVDKKQLETILPKLSAPSKDLKVGQQYQLFQVKELKTVERQPNAQGKQHWFKIDPIEANFAVSRVQNSLIYVFAIDPKYLNSAKQKEFAIDNYPGVEKSINDYINKNHKLQSLTVRELGIPKEAILCCVISNCINSKFYCEIADVQRVLELPEKIARDSIITNTKDIFKKWIGKESSYTENTPVYFCKLDTSNVGKVHIPELKSDNTSSSQQNEKVRSLSGKNDSLFRKLKGTNKTLTNNSGGRKSTASLTDLLGFNLGATDFSKIMEPQDTTEKDPDCSIKPS